ncbi:hypothetical protein PNOK_0863700 [Pyrrhoderma noxium]|uniref:Uncharacterized protein n=1 Tax=Pyrrhoderma noxium TaxID=2282107 RepID=A0A286U8C4_9AGAM|nr:hypothetical protein PNOK_0863700 [Pyrrhoderma noxium]
MQVHGAVSENSGFFGNLRRRLSVSRTPKSTDHTRPESPKQQPQQLRPDVLTRARSGSKSDLSGSGLLTRARSLSKSESSDKGSSHSGSGKKYVGIDMSRRIDWAEAKDAVLDEPITQPPQSLIIVEVEGMDASCRNHGERCYRIEKANEGEGQQEYVSIRDVLVGLNTFLHRRTHKHGFTYDEEEERMRRKKMEKRPVVQIPERRSTVIKLTVSSPDSYEGSEGCSSNSPSIELDSVEIGGARNEFGSGFESGANNVIDSPTSASSSSSLSPPATPPPSTPSPPPTEDETVLQKWLGEKTIFSGIKRAPNHDFRLIVKMTKPIATSSKA